MDDLFEKLKSEPPVNNSQSTEASELKKTCIEDISEPTTREKSVSPVFTLNKSRSNSPNGNEKDCTSSALDGSDSEVPEKVKRNSSVDSNSKDGKGTAEIAEVAKESPKKKMPTKAQKKLFEMPMTETGDEANDAADVSKGTTGDTAVESAVIETKDARVKRCRVRIKRENLIELRDELARAQPSKKGRKIKEQPIKKESPTKALQKVGSKRKAEAGGSPPTKKEKADTKPSGSPPGKKAKPTGFFIKLGSNLKKSPSLPAPKPKQTNTSKKSPQTSKEKVLRKNAPRALNSTPVYTTKATKFTRSQLIRAFGKRYFNSRVRIERCRHPMMLTFESNARARKLQAKNKSKNLSVSFKEQVEIIGLSDTESYESDEVNVTGAEKGAEQLLAGATPLHLKKVENGKVIDDIEFDPTLFGDPNADNNSSTPLRKKKEKKSYSPLKDDSSSSARSELLKSANEKLPPSALRRISAEEEDDEDDECEWIVPIDIPDRRSSRTNSISEKDEKNSTTDDNDQNTAALTDNVETEVIAKETPKEKSPPSDDTEVNTLSDSKNPTDDTRVNTSFDDKNAKEVNGNEVAENGKTPDNEEDKSKNTPSEKLSEDLPKTDFPALLLDNESNSATPNPPFTPENFCTPDLLVKTAIEKLSEDIEKTETDRSETTGLNNATVAESA